MRKTIDLIPLGEKWRKLKLKHTEKSMVAMPPIYRAFNKYVTLSEHKPTLGDYVRCNKDGKVLEEYDGPISNWESKEQHDRWKEYQEAESRLIFEGWRVFEQHQFGHYTQVIHDESGVIIQFTKGGNTLLITGHKVINQVSDLMGLGLKVFEG